LLNAARGGCTPGRPPFYLVHHFFREKPEPWKSPPSDLAADENVINKCGWYRRDEELADAKRAILGS